MLHRLRRVLVRPASVLRQFINDNVEPGSAVITDGWNGYRSITRDSYVHERRSQDHTPCWVPRRTLLRFNRRRSCSRGLVFLRVMQLAVGHGPVRYKNLAIDSTPQDHVKPGAPGSTEPSQSINTLRC